MARGGGASFDVNATGVYGAVGAISGVSETVKTPFYMNAVLRYTHARLSDFFDLWMDNTAKGDMNSFMHVYEWPQKFQNYKETVGNPLYRRWMHTLSGRAGAAQASFQFLPSDRPVPVDPILLTPGPGGRRVKTGVHVFVWKAPVMEYGLPVHITPKLSQYLAYVISKSKDGGNDSDPLRHPNQPEEKGGNVMLSKGPVDLPRAGNGKTWRKFTTAFELFYKTLAQDHMKNDILPQLEHDLVNTVRMQLAMNARSSIKMGTSNRGKKLTIGAFAAENNATFRKAKIEAQKALKKQEQKYIQDAAVRRAKLYGG